MPDRRTREARTAVAADLSADPLFETFRWTDPATDGLLIEARALNQLIEKVIDVADGVRAVMCVLERDGHSSLDEMRPNCWTQCGTVRCGVSGSRRCCC